MTDEKNAPAKASAEDLHMDLASLGVAEVAYLRQAEVDGVDGYAIHAANGQQIGFSPGETSAIAAIMANDMEVASVH